MSFKHSTPEGRESAKSALKHLSEKGEAFIHEHPLFGQEAHFPKTVATIKEMADQLNAGAITLEDANDKVEQAIEDECEEHMNAQGAMPDDVMNALFGGHAYGAV